MTKKITAPPRKKMTFWERHRTIFSLTEWATSGMQQQQQQRNQQAKSNETPQSSVYATCIRHKA